MKLDNLDLESIMDARCKAVEESIRLITIEEMTKLVEQLFPSWDNPWEEIMFKSFQENAGSTFYHAVTNDGIHVLYCADKDNGVWFVPDSSVGILTPNERTLMKKLTEQPGCSIKGMH